MIKSKWYALHVNSGQENTVKQNLKTRIRSMNAESKIFDVVIPKRDVAEIKNGKKLVSTKNFFPGYIIVNCIMDNESWDIIYRTPGVISFAGRSTKPVPLRQKEVDDFLSPQTEETVNEIPVVENIGFNIGDSLIVKSGPFSGNSGYVVEIYPKTLKLKVMVDLFGRETPVELDLGQVSKI